MNHIKISFNLLNILTKTTVQLHTIAKNFAATTVLAAGKSDCVAYVAWHLYNIHTYVCMCIYVYFRLPIFNFVSNLIELHFRVQVC